MRRDVFRDELACDNEVPYSSRKRFVNQAAMRGRCCNLPREVSDVPFEVLLRRKLAECRAIDIDRMGEISRRHSS